MDPEQQRRGGDVRGADATPDAPVEPPPPRIRTTAEEAVIFIVTAAAMGYLSGLLCGLLMGCAGSGGGLLGVWFCVSAGGLVGAVGFAVIVGMVAVSDLIIDQTTPPTDPPGDDANATDTGGRPPASQ